MELPFECTRLAKARRCSSESLQRVPISRQTASSDLSRANPDREVHGTCHPPAIRSRRPEMLSLVSSSRVSLAQCSPTHPPPLLTPRRLRPQTLARSAAPRSVVGAWVAQRGLATAADPYDLVVIGGGELVSF